MTDIAGLLERGGPGRHALLRYCVMAPAPEALFVFLAGEYRLLATHARAVVLYDMFCAPGAPARVRVPSLLPPDEPRLAMELVPIRGQLAQMQLVGPPNPAVTARLLSPPKHLFDALVGGVRSDPDVGFAALGASYDPAREPWESLPGGRMTSAQRQYVEHVWKPQLRPRLVSVGFWRIADVE